MENIDPIWSCILVIFENIDPVLDKNTERIRKNRMDKAPVHGMEGEPR